MIKIECIIDFSINGLSTENRLRSQRTPTPYKIKVNNCKFIDLVIRSNQVNSNNFNATIFKYSEKFEHPFSHVFMFGNMFAESRGFVTMLVTSRIRVIIMFKFIPI